LVSSGWPLSALPPKSGHSSAHRACLLCATQISDMRSDGGYLAMRIEDIRLVDARARPAVASFDDPTNAPRAASRGAHAERARRPLNGAARASHVSKQQRCQYIFRLECGSIHRSNSRVATEKPAAQPPVRFGSFARRRPLCGGLKYARNRRERRRADNQVHQGAPIQPLPPIRSPDDVVNAASAQRFTNPPRSA